jgi:hypothetical protein
MGCDIHGFVEVKDTYYFEDGWTDVITDGLTDRWYSLFGRFFGVRSHGQPHLWGGRGFPKDAGYGTKDDYYDDGNYEKFNPDWHSPSWVLWSELKPFLATDEGKEFLDNAGYSLMFKLMGVLAEKYGDTGVRWVVWFDN